MKSEFVSSLCCRRRSSSSSTALVVASLLLVLSSTISVVVGRDIQRRDAADNGAGQQSESWSDGIHWINHMCAAQCDAFCNENTVDCRRYCRTNDTRAWIIKCHEQQEREVQSAYYDQEDSYLTRNSDCPGTCSILKHQEEAGYFIPGTPDVVLVRDQRNHSMTLTWSRPSTPVTIVYVVQEKEETGSQDIRRWSEAHLVMGGDHFTRKDLGVCSTPTYRVAAVSRYGSHWFSEEVTTPDMVPGPPRMLEVSSIQHDSILMSFIITISWLNPEGWQLSDLKPNTPFDWQNYIKCSSSMGSSMPFTADVIEHNYSFSNNGNTLTFHIADFAVGCKIIYAVSATSKCGDNLVSDRAYLTIDLACHSVKAFYSGQYCTPPPFSPPGIVQNVHISVVPGMHGARAHVTWAPPTDLGTAGAVGYYTVFYGYVDETWGFGFKENTYYNITLPADSLHAVVPVPQDAGSKGKFGLMVMAGAAGHVIDYPIGIMYVINASFSPGRVLLEEDIVVYQIDESRVRVYWTRPEPVHQRDLTGVALQWGPISGVHVDDAVSSVGGAETSGGETKYNASGVPANLRVENSTVVKPNQTFLGIIDLQPSQVYGIKVLSLYDAEGLKDIPDEKWDTAAVYTFVMPAAPAAPATGQTFPNGWTSNTPHASIIPASESATIAAAITVPLVVVVTVLVLVLLWWRWRNGKKLAHLNKLQYPEFRPYTYFMPNNGNDPSNDGDQHHHVADEWEMPHSCIKVGRVLGSGAFGQVMLGKVSRALLRHRGLPPKYSLYEDGSGDKDPLMAPAAIKMLKDGCDESGKAEFLREIELMKELGPHMHVVSMLGCCTLREPYCLLVEHMAGGDLLSYLKNVRKRISESQDESGHYQNHETEFLGPMDLLSFARQIAQGMEFLADRGYVHRDLAARNVLIGEKNEVKVGDFGLARYVYTDQVYVNRKGGKLPLKWMAIESIFDLTFSTASDVWAFGVVLFEIVTLGGTPYPTVHIRDLLKALKGGYRMERPDNCSEEMYVMMRACWQEAPAERPSFSELRQWLEEMMQDCSGVQYLDMTLNPAKDYYTCWNTTSSSSNCSNDSLHSKENEEDDGCSRLPAPLSELFGGNIDDEDDDGGKDGVDDDDELGGCSSSSADAPGQDDESHSAGTASTSLASPERTLTSSHERDGLATSTAADSDIIIHVERNPPVAAAAAVAAAGMTRSTSSSASSASSLTIKANIHCGNVGDLPSAQTSDVSSESTAPNNAGSKKTPPLPFFNNDKKKLSPSCSASSESTIAASPVSVLKSVRFFGAHGNDGSSVKSSDGASTPPRAGSSGSSETGKARLNKDGRNNSNSCSTSSEIDAWNSEDDDANVPCSPSPSPASPSPLSSPDTTAWDDVFTADAGPDCWPGRDSKGWLASSLRRQVPPPPPPPHQRRGCGQPRVFPQEQHPCGLFRVSLVSSSSSTASTSASDELVLPFVSGGIGVGGGGRSRSGPLDSQGESVYTSSSSSGDSVSLPPLMQMMHPLPQQQQHQQRQHQHQHQHPMAGSVRQPSSTTRPKLKSSVSSDNAKQPLAHNQNKLSQFFQSLNQARHSNRYQHNLPQQQQKQQKQQWSRGQQQQSPNQYGHKQANGGSGVSRGAGPAQMAPDSTNSSRPRHQVVFSKFRASRDLATGASNVPA